MKNIFVGLILAILIFTAFANAQDSLVGEWEIVSITKAKVDVPLERAENRITFEKNRFYGTVCNQFNGNYSIVKNKLKTLRVLTTLMACNDIKTEDLIVSVFDKQTYFSLKDNVLSLTDAKKQITLKLERVTKQKPSLVGGWKLDSLKLNGKEFDVSTGREVLLNIKKDKIGGNGGCNSYGGSVAMKGTTIKFSNIFSTKMFCDGSIEDQYFAALEKVVNFELRSSQLILTDKTKQTTLIFNRVPK